MRETREYSVNVGDVEMAVVEWPGDSDPVLMLHATGFHSRCWDQVVKRLLGQHVYAVDLRFHGRTAIPGDQRAVDWNLLAKDVGICIARLELERLVGVGHSIGGHLITRVAASAPTRFKQLVLIDPVIFAPETYARFSGLVSSSAIAEHPVARRKNAWQDADEMFSRFRQKPPFDSWQPEVLRDYCDYALLPADTDDVMTLACDPVNEASIYLSQSGNEVIFEEIPGLQTPVTLLRAPPGVPGKMDFSASPTWPGLAAALPCCRDIYLENCNHFIPMQEPALVADYIKEAQQDQWQHAR